MAVMPTTGWSPIVKNNEIASLELGLKNVTLERKTDGYFVGSNFPINEKLAREETDFDMHDMSSSANARHVRWEQLMAENKGKIDVAAAQRFLADHYDTFDKKTKPTSARSAAMLICRREECLRGSPLWDSGRGAEQSYRCNHGGEDGAYRNHGARLRHDFSRCRASTQPPGIH